MDLGVMTHDADDMQILNVDEIEPVEVVPGIVRRRLPATAWARGWMYDFAPGARPRPTPRAGGGPALFRAQGRRTT